MEVKKLQCDLCGGELEMQAGGKQAKCKACGMVHSIERMREKVQEIKGTVKVEGPVTVTGVKTKEDLLKNAQICVDIHQYEKAEKIYQQVIDEYPGESRGWWGMYELKTLCSTSLKDLVCCDLYAKTAMKLEDYSDKYRIFWEEYCEKYCQEIGGIGSDLEISEPFRFNSTQAEIMMYGENELPNEYIKEGQRQLLEKYYFAFKKGECTFCDLRYLDVVSKKVTGQGVSGGVKTSRGDILYAKSDEYRDNEIFQKIMKEGVCNAGQLERSDIYYAYKIRDKIKSCRYIRDLSDVKKEWVYSSSHSYSDVISLKIAFFFGRTIIASMRYVKEGRLMEERVLIQLNCTMSIDQLKLSSPQGRIAMNRCMYCGGEFQKVRFGWKCSKCGQRKDY